uniref:UDP-glycosyltransferases domain-containing protein n=1 Tax=Alexandrium catenella TaxID=2925 RepID=A0A7S1QSV9_ALECA|mmetsp:Transcript_37943/g.102751  ORF Transcript_37943/g.102751 Transcript_37943/m.102751 type:complete len:498 (+) Transcript_37943:87-1580(+)
MVGLANSPAAAAADAQPCVVAIFNVAMIGHVNPTFALVQELVRRGCRVHYFLPPSDSIREAASEAGAVVEAYEVDDDPDFALELCGTEGAAEVPEGERMLWEKAVWPLASTLATGDHIIARCRDLGVQAVLYDPVAPHGILVGKALGVPFVSLVTYPGMGSLAGMLSDERRLRRARAIRAPLGAQIRKRFGVDVGDQLMSRRQYYAPENFVTTSEVLVVPLPAPGKASWSDEVRKSFRFTAVGCMVSDSAPHVISARSPKARGLERCRSFGHALPLAELRAAALRGARIVYCALGTMALSDRWESDLGKASGGNLPAGTTGKQFCEHVWRALLAAMRELGEAYFCVLAVGRQPDATDFLLGLDGEPAEALPGNVALRTFVPQVDMLRCHAGVFITHAGFNSVQESLMAGVPMIAVPQAVDQPANARKIEACGWGRAFLQPMGTVSGPSLAAALRAVSSPGAPYSTRVAKVREQLEGGAVRATERLLELAAKSTACSS